MGITKADTVKLISAEGFEFVIHREAAMISNTLKNMLSSSGGFQETELGEVRFPEISTPILEKLCQFFYYKLRYTNRDSEMMDWLESLKKSERADTTSYKLMWSKGISNAV